MAITIASVWVAVRYLLLIQDVTISGIELNAVQRANAEMQKRAYNVVRALCEEDINPVVSIHDHGSAGHVNCLSELVEECGGLIRYEQIAYW